MNRWGLFSLVTLTLPFGCWSLIEGDLLIQGPAGSGGATGSTAVTGGSASTASTGDAGPLCGAHVWSKAFTADSLAGMALDPDDNILLTGYIGKPVDFGDGPLAHAGWTDAYVAKLDPAGNHIFSRSFGDGDEQYGLRVAADASGNVLLVGGFRGTINLGGDTFTNQGSEKKKNAFIAKLDPDGKHLWSKTFSGDADAWPHAIALDAEGGAVVTGVTFGTIDYGGGALTSAGVDVFVAKLDADGNHVFSKIFGDGNEQRPDGISVDSAGNVLVTGFFHGSIDFSGGEPGKALTSAGVRDGFIAKLDASGNHLWSKRFGDDKDLWLAQGAFDGSDNVIISSSFMGTADLGGGPLASFDSYDILVAKLDPDGNYLWGKSFNGTSDQILLPTAGVDRSGNVLLAGQFVGPFTFGGELLEPKAQDAFFAILDPSGQHLWSARYGDYSIQFGTGIGVDSKGDIVVGGVFGGTIDLGGDGLDAGQNALKIFLAKLEGCP
jgi:hypothetical protein